MKIYSWNVNGLRAVIRKGALAEFLNSEKPDILCMQEIKAKKDQVEIDLPDYIEYWNPAERPGYSGTATFVKNEFSVVQTGNKLSESDPQSLQGPLAPWDNDESHKDGSEERPEENLLQSVLQEGRVLTTEFPYFYLVNVYTPNSKPNLSRLDLRENLWDPSFLNYLRTLEQKKPVIVCGDFNAAHTEIDLARPDNNHKNAGFTDEERQGIKNLISAGFVDTFRYFYPGVQRYTWWSHWGNARANNVGWRIDYFFISQKLLPYLKSANIHEHIAGSDHCPISIELDLPV